MKRIALIGMPNTGKSTFFNRLTGASAKIGNWPGITVELLSAKIMEGSEMVDEAADILSFLTVEPEFLKAWAADTGDFISNPAIIDEIKGDFAEEFLGGQNHYETFAEMAPAVDASALQGYDQDINTILSEQLTAYSLGEKELEAAMADFKVGVQNAFPNVMVD